MAKAEMGKLHAYAKAQVSASWEVRNAALLSTFQVKILSGEGIPSWRFGWKSICTVDWKISPQKSYRKKLFRTIAEKGMPEPVPASACVSKSPKSGLRV